jgi:hypothetical protein
MLRPKDLSTVCILSILVYMVNADGTGHHGSHGADHGAGGHGDHSASHGGDHSVAHGGGHEAHPPHHAVQSAPSSHHNSSYRTEAHTSPVVTTYLPSGGGCGHKTYDPQYLKGNIDELDYQIQSVLASLPQAIQAGRAAVETNTLATNRDVLIVGLACLLGAVSGTFGILHGALGASLTPAQSTYLVAMNSWGYGYWGPYLLELDDVDPGCGVEDYEQLVYEYNFITSLDHVYGPHLGSGGYAGQSSDDRPELRKYYVGEFARKMKLALHCITSQSGSVAEARAVTTLIEKYQNLASRRLDLTSTVMSY